MPRRFSRIEKGVNLERLLQEIAQHPAMWTADAQRQSNVSVQRETEAVMICGHDSDRSFREARQQHPITYVGRPTAVSADFPHALAIVQGFARRAYGVPGRAVLVRLKPRGRVYEHVDRGLYYQLRHRYHLVVKSVLGSRLRAGPEEMRMREGEIWWFDNRLPHEAVNDSDEDRIHLIFDILSPASLASLPLRMFRSPRETLQKLGKRLRRIG
jgi:hypothetical protein